MQKDGVDTFYAEDGQAWRAWLEANHLLTQSVWLIIYKKGADTPSVYYDEAVDEALCFGWIDSKPNKRDGESYYQFFSRRNPKSNWSGVNKRKIARLLKSGRMAPAGLEMIELAKKTGTWTALDAVEKGIIPPDLGQAFDDYPGSAAHFEAFPISARRGILEWIQTAKRPETRAKRVEETARLAAQNIRANQWKPK